MNLNDRVTVSRPHRIPDGKGGFSIRADGGNKVWASITRENGSVEMGFQKGADVRRGDIVRVKRFKYGV